MDKGDLPRVSLSPNIVHLRSFPELIQYSLMKLRGLRKAGLARPGRASSILGLRDVIDKQEIDQMCYVGKWSRFRV